MAIYADLAYNSYNSVAELMITMEMQEKKNEQGFNFLESLFRHMKRFLSVITAGSLEKSEESIVSLGRTDDEKEQLKEMCEENRIARRRLKELREARKNGMSHGEWLEQTADHELTKVYPEITEQEKDEVKDFLEKRFFEDMEANAEVLDEETDQTVEVTKGGNQ